MAGILFGLGIFTFSYAEGLSYFSNDPSTCINCHIMRDQFEGWNHSSHQEVATCNDCHTPHRFPDKWLVKGLNGWNHSRAFTTGDFAEPIQITEFNAKIAYENCIDCHQTALSFINSSANHEAELNCVGCHGNVGHGG